ncbi:hypothetical protein OHB93_14505 [Microbacterium sp. No. 7]|uniref:hypothetical protein n=1 Tax=Microbacterium sp. No. 7 TaxID=1714373 RepID=UPI003008D662
MADNAAQARDRLSFADARLTEAQSEVAAGDGAGAAVGIRAAEQAVDQASRLQEAIEKLAADLAEAERGGAALVTELDADLAAAAATPTRTRASHRSSRRRARTSTPPARG